MPEKNGKRDTQRTETGYEIPVPKREDVMDALNKVVKKKPPVEEDSRSRKRRKPSEPS